MPRLELVQQFNRQLQTLNTENDLALLMAEVTLEMGFDYFALINHVDLRNTSTNVIQFNNYPEPWSRHFIESGLYADDPILKACAVSNIGFSWADVPHLIDITPKQKLILEEAANQGLIEGFTIPVNIPGEFSGSCSFAARRSLDLPQDYLLVAQLIGAFAFNAARRLKKIGLVYPMQIRNLTQRQRDCLIWAIRGKTDWEIGRILGLNEETVSRHLDMARARYGVTKRLPLAVHAIFDGQISFIEALF
jgi:LuxR family quorum-sensing system transcriptional regulator CciR